MEKVTDSTKGKKRRTRRCLDEIKNRLRRKCGNSFEHSILNTKSCIFESKKLENRLVTMDRLTLKAMFPNAIRSETITRPVLKEIKQKNNLNFVKSLTDCTIKKTHFSLDQELVNNKCNTGASFHDSMAFTECGENSLYNKDNKHKNHDDLKSSYSLVLFSPAGPINKALALNVNEEDTITSSTSSQTTQNCTHWRYEELMNEIPSYIRHLASSINKGDAIKKTINSLQKLYMESFHKECEDNVKNSNTGHILTTSKTFHSENQMTVENPLDYIRLKQERQQNRGSPLVALSDSLSPDKDTALSPTSLPCASLPDLHVDIAPYDTPDYNYYPHRLK